MVDVTWEFLVMINIHDEIQLQRSIVYLRQYYFYKPNWNLSWLRKYAESEMSSGSIDDIISKIDCTSFFELIDEIESWDANSCMKCNLINKEARFAERVKAYEKIFYMHLDAVGTTWCLSTLLLNAAWRASEMLCFAKIAFPLFTWQNLIVWVSMHVA